MVKKRFLVVSIITILAAIAILLNMPRIPLNINLGPISFNRVLQKPNINLQISDFKFAEDLDLNLGLDLQGGTSLVLQANVQDIAPEERDKALEAVKEVIERRINFFGVSESIVQTSKIGDEEYRVVVEMPGVTDLDQARNLIGQTAKLEFREFKDVNNIEPTTFPTLDNTLPSGVTGRDIESATADFQAGAAQQESADPVVRFELTNEGAEKFREATSRLIGQPLIIFLDDIPISAPIVQSEIENEGVITGVTSEEAKTLAIQLSAGALPVENIEVISEKNIGPSLGKESINKSLVAGVIGLISLIFFMVIYYRLPGVVASVALVLYALFVLSVFRIVPITLTLAGIAGFILSIGMAVDANILIFERMKEELRIGRTRTQAIEIGFSRAWSSIRDSNASSLITSVILFWFGTGAVRGFALALAIGILISMLTAIFITRNFLRVVYKS